MQVASTDSLASDYMNDPDPNLPIKQRKNNMAKELATQNVISGYPALLETSRERTKEIYEETFPEGFQARDMEQIRLHPDKSRTLLSNLKDSDTEKGMEELHFIALSPYQPLRVCFEEGVKMPVCTSVDAKIGVGKYGGSCNECPMSKFGSGKGGRGQACTQKIAIPILKRGSLLPSLLVLPPTSIRNWTNYTKGLGYDDTNPRLSREIETIATVSMKKGEVHTYNQVTFRLANDLAPDQIQTVKDLSLMIASKPSNFDGVMSHEDADDAA